MFQTSCTVDFQGELRIPKSFLSSQEAELYDSNLHIIIVAGKKVILIVIVCCEEVGLQQIVKQLDTSPEATASTRH